MEPAPTPKVASFILQRIQGKRMTTTASSVRTIIVPRLTFKLPNATPVQIWNL